MGGDIMHKTITILIKIIIKTLLQVIVKRKEGEENEAWTCNYNYFHISLKVGKEGVG